MSRATVRGLGILAAVIMAGAAYVGTGGLSDWPQAPSPAASSTRTGELVDAAELASASDQLQALTVAKLSHDGTYERTAFGQRWADVDRNGCDQRNDALRAGATEVTFKPGTHDCVVLEATIEDPYSGITIRFIKGENTVDIDHIVPLSRAWQQGAAQWPEERREEFANTSENLLAVDASANRSKGDKGPEEWMPEVGRCAYVARWIDIKTEFDLTVSTEERAALEGELTTCEGNL